MHTEALKMLAKAAEEERDQGRAAMLATSKSAALTIFDDAPLAYVACRRVKLAKGCTVGHERLIARPLSAYVPVRRVKARR